MYDRPFAADPPRGGISALASAVPASFASTASTAGSLAGVFCGAVAVGCVVGGAYFLFEKFLAPIPAAPGVTQSMSNVVCVAGKMGVGKDTASAVLVEKHGYVRISLADPLRKMALSTAKTLLGIEDALLSWFVDPEKKGETFSVLSETTLSERVGGLTPRFVMQQLGTEIVRKHLGQDIWVDTAIKKMKELCALHFDHPASAVTVPNFVVSDWRFPNEKKRFDETFWLVPFGIHVVAATADEGAAQDDARKHVSETALVGFDMDKTIISDRRAGAAALRDAMEQCLIELGVLCRSGAQRTCW